MVHLSARSTYSALDGAFRPRDLPARAKEIGQNAVALTDHCGLYGASEFHKACTKWGVKGIYGTSIWLWPDGVDQIGRKVTATRPTGSLSLFGSSPQADPNLKTDRGFGVTLLAINRHGYKNLCHLISGALGKINFRPRTDLRALSGHNEGVIALIGAWTYLLDQEQAEKAIGEIGHIFGPERTYVELTDNGIPGQRERSELLARLSLKANLPLVATNDVRYLLATDAPRLQVLHSIQQGCSVDQIISRGGTDQKYLKSEAEMGELEFPRSSLLETQQIADRCCFVLETGVYHFPRTEPSSRLSFREKWAQMQRSFPLPPHVRGERVAFPEGVLPDSKLVDAFYANYARLGLKHRLKKIATEEHQEYIDRLEYEIGVTQEMGFSAYMLIVAEFINWSKQEGIPIGPGRGSVAGALHAWAMGITEIDSIKFRLFFERFLNPGRQSMPDVDVDFSKARREEAIEHVKERYGRDSVAQIATLMKLMPKVAIKDSARALNVHFRDANKWTSLIEDGAKELIKSSAPPKAQGRLRGDPVFIRTWTTASRLTGMIRQTGVHAAGVVIGDGPLTDLVPVTTDQKTGRTTICADMDSAELQGIIKYDFLGLVTLDIIDLTCKTIKERTGTEIDINQIPLDDEPTLQLLQAAHTIGTFQMESSGMQDLIHRLQPTEFEHVIALVALYRPGPLQSGLVDQFVECRHGRQEVKYLWPSLEPILRSTYGAIIYQEQVLEIARSLAGFSLAEADLMRRAIGKKKASEMAQQREKFISGCRQKEGMPTAIATELFDIIDHFSGYSFNRSHSAAYAMISFQTAWLKANHPREFMAAVLSWEKDETKLAAYIQECRRMEIAILPPHINLSMATFTLEGENAIRFSLQAIKHVGGNALSSLLRSRAKGPFKSPEELGTRIPARALTKRVIQSLAFSGALDPFPGSRLALTSQVRPTRKRGSAPNKNQFDLFRGEPKTEEAEFWGERSKLREEKAVLGTWISGHPLDLYGGFHRQVRDLPLQDIKGARGGSVVRLVGVLTKIHTIKNAKGEKMAFLTFIDEGGWAEVCCFSDKWREYASVEAGSIWYVEARVEKAQDTTRLTIARMEPLTRLRTRISRSISIWFPANSTAPPGRVAHFIATHPSPAGQRELPVRLSTEDTEGNQYSVQLPSRAAFTPELTEGLERLGVSPRDIHTYR